MNAEDGRLIPRQASRATHFFTAVGGCERSGKKSSNQWSRDGYTALYVLL